MVLYMKIQRQIEIKCIIIEEVVENISTKEEKNLDEEKKS